MQTSFWKWLARPQGRNGPTVVIFLVAFIFGLSLLSNELTQLSDWNTQITAGTCSNNSTLDVLSMILRAIGIVLCWGVDFYLFGILWSEYRNHSDA